MTKPLHSIPDRVSCPRCKSEDHVTRKLHALPTEFDWKDPATELVPAMGFVKGYWCVRCEIGFIPDELLMNFGLVQVRGI